MAITLSLPWIYFVVCLVHFSYAEQEKRFKYSALTAGATLEGAAGSMSAQSSEILCSRRCLEEYKCLGFQYDSQGTANCQTIRAPSGAKSDQAFQTQSSRVIFKQDFCGTSDPCLNGGICRDRSESFTCECSTGFTGPMCESLDACVSSPCLNGATCVNHSGFSYWCECPPEYTGLHCESPNACWSLPCLNGGTCLDDGKGSYWCLCGKNTAGENCEILT